MNLSKNNCFSAEDAKNYIPRNEKRKKVPACEMLTEKIIAYRDSSTIPPSSKLKLLCQNETTSTVTKSFIIDNLGVRDPPLVCLFSAKNISKKIKTYRSQHLHVQSQKQRH